MEKFWEIQFFWLKKFRLITKNPGLQQINEDVFLDFDFKDLEFLESVNGTFAEILADLSMGSENFSKLRSMKNDFTNQDQWDKSEERLTKKIKIAKNT